MLPLIVTRERAVRRQRMYGTGEREFFSPGRAPALVAFHGFGGTAAELMPVLKAAAAAGFAVDAALLPGHGDRVEDLQNQTFDAWLAAARGRAVAAAKTHGRVVLLGFSLGSLLALTLASERPDWLAGVAVLGNAVTVRAHTSVPLGLWDLSGRPMPDLYLDKPRSGDLVDPTLMDAVVTYDRHPLRAALEVYRAGPRVRAVVHRIGCPMLVLHGLRDRVCHVRNAAWLVQHVGSDDVSVRIFRESAHVLACDGERDEVAREVVRFVQRV